jgi:hypothetical protein
MAWTTPRTWVLGELVTETILNEHIRDNFDAVRASQQSIGGFFRGLKLRTHPDADLSATKVMLEGADSILLNDGQGVKDWPVLTADISLPGAGGLDAGTELALQWYEIYAIRKSSDGTRNLLLHRAPDILTDETQLTTGSFVALRDASARTSVAQGFKTDESSPVVRMSVQLQRVGSPTGQVYLTLESDVAGSPSAILATSDKLDISVVLTSGMQWLEFVFRTPYTVTAGTQYHLRVNGTWTVSGANYAKVGTAGSDAYPTRGQIKTFDGASTWTGVVDDATFSVHVLRNTTAVTMPTGYDQSALIGYVYNNGSSNFHEFEARDRRVLPLGSRNIYNAAVTTQSPIDLRAFVPPRQLTLWCIADVGSGTIVSVSPLPNGYQAASASAPRVGGSAKIKAANNHIEALAGIHVIHQTAYTVTDGTALLYVGEWEW